MRKEREKEEHRRVRMEQDAVQSDSGDFAQLGATDHQLHKWSSETLDAPMWNDGCSSPGFAVVSPELIDLTNSPPLKSNFAKSETLSIR